MEISCAVGSGLLLAVVVNLALARAPPTILLVLVLVLVLVLYEDERPSQPSCSISSKVRFGT